MNKVSTFVRRISLTFSLARYKKSYTSYRKNLVRRFLCVQEEAA